MSFFWGAGRNILVWSAMFYGGVCFSTFALGARYSLYFTSTYMFLGDTLFIYLWLMMGY